MNIHSSSVLHVKRQVLLSGVQKAVLFQRHIRKKAEHFKNLRKMSERTTIDGLQCGHIFEIRSTLFSWKVTLAFLLHWPSIHFHYSKWSMQKSGFQHLNRERDRYTAIAPSRLLLTPFQKFLRIWTDTSLESSTLRQAILWPAKGVLTKWWQKNCW